MTKEMVCIRCPLGCHLTVDDSDKKNIKVSGYTCLRGKQYAIDEVTAPKRMVTSTIRVVGSNKELISVKTSEPIPKEKIFECLEIMKETTANAPVEIGDVLIKNIFESGADIVSTMNAIKM